MSATSAPTTTAAPDGKNDEFSALDLVFRDEGEDDVIALFYANSNGGSAGLAGASGSSKKGKHYEEMCDAVAKLAAAPGRPDKLGLGAQARDEKGRPIAGEGGEGAVW